MTARIWPFKRVKVAYKCMSRTPGSGLDNYTFSVCIFIFGTASGNVMFFSGYWQGPANLQSATSLCLPLPRVSVLSSAL